MPNRGGQISAEVLLNFLRYGRRSIRVYKPAPVPDEMIEQLLEAGRWAPSASNRQPWRVLRQGQAWHFFLQRTPGYGKVSEPVSGGSDLQRVDMGIAMCHFELTAKEMGLEGRWTVDPEAAGRPEPAEYVVSWLAG